MILVVNLLCLTEATGATRFPSLADPDDVGNTHLLIVFGFLLVNTFSRFTIIRLLFFLCVSK